MIRLPESRRIDGAETMKKTLAFLLAVGVLSGCTSTGSTDRLDSLEREMASIKRTAEQALEAARDAQSKVSSMSSGANEAQRMARQAMDTATETAERVARMEDECCGGK